MNRREFLKGIGVVGAGVGAAAIPQVGKTDLILNDAKLVRNTDGGWILIYDAQEPLDSTGIDELTVEIGNKIFRLSGLSGTTFRLNDNIYHNNVWGLGWEQLG